MTHPSITVYRERILANTVKQDCGYLTPCWVWQLYIQPPGYGQIGTRTLSLVKRRHDVAHRVAYLLWVGPIPEKHDIDHLCRNPACCNPDHLEAVPHKENCKRGLQGDLKTHCRYGGHPWIPENWWYRKDGKRTCLLCKRASATRHRLAKRAEPSPDVG